MNKNLILIKDFTVKMYIVSKEIYASKNPLHTFEAIKDCKTGIQKQVILMVGEDTHIRLYRHLRTSKDNLDYW